MLLSPPLPYALNPTRGAGVAEFKNGLKEDGGRREPERWYQEKDSWTLLALKTEGAMNQGM